MSIPPKSNKTPSKKQMGSAAQQAAMKKLAAMNDKKGGRSGGGSKNKWISLKDGDKKVIRIANPWTGNEDDLFYKEQVQHFGLGPEGKTPGICPDPSPNGCPAHKKVWDDREQLIKKAALDLKAKGEPSDKKAAVGHAMKAFKKQWDQAGRIQGKTRYIVNAVELEKDGNGDLTVNAEGNGWGLWSFGPQIMQQILSYFTDTIEWGVFYDPDNAYDFVVTRTGSDFDTTYKVIPTRKFVEADTSSLDINDLDQFKPHTPEQIQQLLDGEELEREEEEAPKPKVSVKLPAKKAVEEDEDEVEDAEDEVEEEEDADEDVEEDEDEVAPPPKKSKVSALEEELKSAAKKKR